MPLTAQVAVADATVYYDKQYSYLVPAPLEGQVFVGSMVLVPFGRGRARPRIGVVLALEETADIDARVKEILDAAPAAARLTEELLAIVSYLQEATFCTWFEAVKAVIPYGAQYKAVQTEEGWRLRQRMAVRTEVVYCRAEAAEGEIAGPGNAATTKVTPANAMMTEGAAVETAAKDTCEGAETTGAEAVAVTGKAVADSDASGGAKPRKMTPKQQAVFDFVAEGPRSRDEVLAACGVGRGVPEGLVKRGLLVAKQREVAEGLPPDAGLAGEQKLRGHEGVFAAPGKPMKAVAEAMATAETAVHGTLAAVGPRESEAAVENLQDGGLTGEGLESSGLPQEAGEAGGAGEAAAPAALPPLSTAQRAVADALLQRMGQPAPKPVLLHGVTGSGKTVVFLPLIEAALKMGKTALVLVPEIGLTPQMINRLRQAFGNLVSVQHSALSDGERLAQWRQIRSGRARVVVGTRSAVFAPLDAIGLVVVDEEQERTYQSENAPRYDAVDIARRRAARHGALLLLASATPAVSDYYMARQGRFELLRLEQRYGELPLPAVEMADMRGELAEGNAGAVGGRLLGEMRRAIDDGRQVILLLNRRGYHRVGVCRACHEAVRCEECSVPMVYHRKKINSSQKEARQGDGGERVVSDMQNGDDRLLPGDRLMCHYCGRVESPPPTVCPKCGGEIRYAGAGTQRLEEELARKLPGVRLLRMDLDSTGRKGAHADMLASFAKGEYDVLLGTQMVAKGLDFERVSLVGVVGIDALLFSQGYRAFENVFSLITQVVGRSGRFGQQGRALIQTNDPQNPVLELAARQDYERFYEQEIAFRKLALYPPFCVLCTVGFAGADEGKALSAARRFAVLLAGEAARQPEIPLRILGPAPMQLAQLGGSYRYRLTLKCRGDAAFRALARRVLDAYYREGWPKKAGVWLDFHSGEA